MHHRVFSKMTDSLFARHGDTSIAGSLCWVRLMIHYDIRSWHSVVFRLKGSVLPRLLPRIVMTAGVGAIAAWAYSVFKFHLSPLAHTLIGAALGLLLVFRTNASYDRFWEGRKLMGSVVNRSRDLVRQIATYVGDGPLATDLRRQVVAMTSLIIQMLRREKELGVLGERLTQEERRRLEPVVSRPTVMARWIGGRLRGLADAGRITEFRLQLMDGNLTALIDSMGGAERIMRTPVPFAYAQHIKTFVVLFCLTVPFAMAEAMGSYTPIASALLAFALFGIDEIGVEIEDPFGYDENDLPLDAIAATVETDTLQLIESGELG